MRLDSRRRASAPRAGVQTSRLRGRGVDYRESRSYQPGDDIRNMDWRVTARSGKAHVKVYQEERERPVIVVVDYSPSMFFGTRVMFKSVLAAKLAALIGWAAIHNGDRIGAFLFGARGHQEVQPAGGKRGALALIQRLVEWSASDAPGAPNAPDDGAAAGGRFGEELQRLRRVARPGSLVFMISDFYALDGDSEHNLGRLRQHNDVIACQVMDVIENQPPPPGRYPVSDGVQRRVLDTTSVEARHAYQDYFARHHARVRELTQRRGVPLIPVVTDDDPAAALQRGLARV